MGGTRLQRRLAASRAAIARGTVPSQCPNTRERRGHSRGYAYERHNTLVVESYFSSEPTTTTGNASPLA